MNIHISTPARDQRIKPVLGLFRVFGPGRENLGTYGHMSQAKKARDAYNAKLGSKDRKAWIGAGPDHWSSAFNRDIPKRPDEIVYVPDGKHVSGLTRKYVSPAEFWLS